MMPIATSVMFLGCCVPLLVQGSARSALLLGCGAKVPQPLHTAGSHPSRVALACSALPTLLEDSKGPYPKERIYRSSSNCCTAPSHVTPQLQLLLTDAVLGVECCNLGQLSFQCNTIKPFHKGNTSELLLENSVHTDPSAASALTADARYISRWLPPRANSRCGQVIYQLRNRLELKGLLNESRRAVLSPKSNV